MADPEKSANTASTACSARARWGSSTRPSIPGIERVVAIKTVRKDLVDPDLVEQSMARFKNEARAAGRLLHPNIVSVYEYGEDDANAFIVMEYVEGTGLREFLNRGASFDLPQVVAIMTQLLLALDFAHERGVIHRDIKPANLILTASGHAEGRRLRHRPHRHLEPDDAGHGDGNAVVHVARAVPGPDGRPALRPVQRRRRALRAASPAKSRSAARSRRSPTRSATKIRGRRRRCRA